jgi:CheY-like chemotaxis protein
VPIWTEDQLENYLFFINGLITVISESGLKNLKEIEHRKQIQKSEQHYKSILKAAMDGYWLTDISGRLLEVNDAYCRMTGYSEEELLAMQIADLEAMEKPDIVADHMKEIIAKGPEQTAEHGNETILLVEDERTILEMTTKMLERLGYNVVAAATPSQALHLAHEYQERIDLLMTDVVMPEMNGQNLAENLLSLYPGLRCLFMSGYTADVIANHGLLDKGVHLIEKPFSKKNLGVKLREALGGPRDSLSIFRVES